MANCLDKYICDSSDNCTVVITDENGVEIDTRFLHDGDIVYLNYEEREGYTFEGFTDENGNPVGEYYAPGMYEVEVVCGGSYIANYSTNLYEIDATPCNDEGGAVTGSGEYPYGAEVELVATEDEGYHFSGWYIGEEMVSSDINYSFTVRNDVEICALFEGDEYYIIAKPNDPNLGTATGTGVYHRGDVAVLSAIPFEGSVFINWDNGVTNNQWNLTVLGNGVYVANFERTLYTVTVNIINESPTRGDMIPGFATGGGTFGYGTSVTLGATAYSTFSFVRWEIDGVVVGTDNTYQLTVTNNIVVNAYFNDVKYRLTLHVLPENGGYTVDSNSNPYTGGEYYYGTTVSTTAIPNPSYTFVRWDDNTTLPQHSYIMVRDIDATAYFRQAQVGRLVTLRINYNQTQGTVKIYKNNEDVTEYGNNIAVSPAVTTGTNLRVVCEGINGYIFDRYLDDNNRSADHTFYMNADMEKTVLFKTNGVCTEPMNFKVDNSDYCYFTYNGVEYSDEEGVDVTPSNTTAFTVKARQGYYIDKLIDVTDENNPVDVTPNSTKTYCYDYYFLADENENVTFYFPKDIDSPYTPNRFIGQYYYYKQIFSAPAGITWTEDVNDFSGNTEGYLNFQPDNGPQYVRLHYTNYYTPTSQTTYYYFEQTPIPSDIPIFDELPYVVGNTDPDFMQWGNNYCNKLKLNIHFAMFTSNFLGEMFVDYSGIIDDVNENSDEFVYQKTPDSPAYRKKVCSIICNGECGHKYVATVKYDSSFDPQQRPYDSQYIYWILGMGTLAPDTIVNPNRVDGGFLSIYELDKDVSPQQLDNSFTLKAMGDWIEWGAIIQLGC